MLALKTYFHNTSPAERGNTHFLLWKLMRRIKPLLVLALLAQLGW
jgi:hypothetical protein